MSRLLGKGIDLYEILSVSSSASFAEIRSAYRKAALKAHPDKGRSSRAFHLVTVAFETLSHDRLRVAYDRWRQHALEKSLAKKKESAHSDANESSGRDLLRTKDHSSVSHCGVKRCSISSSACAASSSSSSSPCADNADKLHESKFALEIDESLEKLRVASQALLPDIRRALLNKLEERVRIRFLRCMETRQRANAETITTTLASLPNELPSDSDLHSDDARETTSGSDDVDKCILEIENFEIDAELATEEVSPISQKSDTRRAPRGVETMRGTRSKNPSYRASLSFASLKWCAKFQSSLDVAIDQHILLVQIRELAMGRKQRDKALSTETDSIIKAHRSVFAENGCLPEDVGLVVATRLVLHDRRSASAGLNHNVVVHSPMLSVDEALCWRERLISARVAGWCSFRILWIELLQHPIFSQKRIMSAPEAEAFVDAQWVVIADHWMRMEEIRARARDAPKLAESIRLERCFNRAAARVRRCIDEELVASRRAVAEARK